MASSKEVSSRGLTSNLTSDLIRSPIKPWSMLVAVVRTALSSTVVAVISALRPDPSWIVAFLILRSLTCAMNSE